MPAVVEVMIFLLGWSFLAGAGWLLYLKVRSIEQKHEALLAIADRLEQMDQAPPSS